MFFCYENLALEKSISGCCSINLVAGLKGGKNENVKINKYTRRRGK